MKFTPTLALATCVVVLSGTPRADEQPVPLTATVRISDAKPLLDWTQVTPAAPWQPRDSQGEVVFKNRLWLMGGWYNSWAPPPRDVWSSPDGKEWKLVTKEAPWKHSDLPMTIAFKDKMWLMGGWYNGRLPGHESSNEVWSSKDGEKWEQVTTNAGWSPRLAGALVEFKGRMWVLGGIENYYFGDEKSLKNDVWSSSDGKTWRCETQNAGWSPRAYHQAAVLGGRIYVFGGGNYTPKTQMLNDVWSSADGKTWRQETANAPWVSRLWFSTAIYRDRVWVIGGWVKDEGEEFHNLDDLWYTRNGRDWTQFKTGKIWKERHEHSVWVFQDKLWVGGGHAIPLNNEVWSLHIPRDYFRE